MATLATGLTFRGWVRCGHEHVAKGLPFRNALPGVRECRARESAWVSKVQGFAAVHPGIHGVSKYGFRVSESRGFSSTVDDFRSKSRRSKETSAGPKALSFEAQIPKHHVEDSGFVRDSVERQTLTKAPAQAEWARLYAKKRERQGSEREVGEDQEKALQRLHLAAEAGIASAQFRLAMKYGSGTDGVQLDEQNAIKWFQKAAVAGDARAQFIMGGMYAEGECGLQRDMRKAVKWFRKAAVQEHRVAQFNMSICYKLGAGGLPQDDREAVKWCRRSAENDYDTAQYTLGSLHSSGECGVTLDHYEAQKWIRKAAMNGHAHAQFLMGVIYVSGHCGLPVDDRAAKRWFRMAAAQGDENAAMSLRQLQRTF
ncbi:Secretory immunoglobulin A-binding protein EsiB [Porphyridium purpureum]|uniref:Secretory immunoglobulin A-binding protein EsiB n=1 Tax=Porphyridium purpureum TaxID=35688 RepID=A0A5J4YXC4_PORPP|nr:Secretory immunoglobulin A-binding protein EsiB [Porphyridium purpureum]|eukprot:POR7506..scf209_3